MRLLILLIFLVLPSVGRAVVVSDLSGRQVIFDQPPKNIILSEGRMMYLVMALQPQNPGHSIRAMADDLAKADQDTWQKLTELYPSFLNKPTVASPSTGQFDVEQAFSLNADLVIFSLNYQESLQQSETLNRLDALSIPYLFIDYRHDLSRNLLPSMNILGKVLGREAQAQKFSNFVQKQLNIVEQRLAENKHQQPLVLLERAAGINGPVCCRVFGQANFGAFAEMAGGKNWGSSKTSGVSVDLNSETLLVEDFDIIIATTGNWSHKKQSISPPLGYSAEQTLVDSGMKALVQRTGWSQMPVVKNKKVYVIWHQFYNHPGYFVAIQMMAKWMHPSLFTDLNPEQVWQEYHQQFMPFQSSGIFWSQLP
ncbi:iron ABC transporter, substrate binding protein [Moritella viscosa]|nr:iron ABC transporter, substrate binding protein [Moritella viscosa]